MLHSREYMQAVFCLMEKPACFTNSRNRAETARTDVWPEAKIASEAEERFLKLPDSDDYKRVRQFKIDEKGAVVSRGDSFRRKRMSNAGTTFLLAVNLAN
uniref:Uncharacterized protein n=1 Tax=Parascaris equorum TaxID=6256 RepID=A0A914SAE5_PAREQ